MFLQSTGYEHAQDVCVCVGVCGGCVCVCRCVLKYSRHIPVPIYTAPPDVYAESSHCQILALG